jgi:hypothetical protein
MIPLLLPCILAKFHSHSERILCLQSPMSDSPCSVDSDRAVISTYYFMQPDNKMKKNSRDLWLL